MHEASVKIKQTVKKTSTSVLCAPFVIIIIRELAERVTRSEPIERLCRNIYLSFRKAELLDYRAGKLHKYLA